MATVQQNANNTMKQRSSVSGRGGPSSGDGGGGVGGSSTSGTRARMDANLRMSTARKQDDEGHGKQVVGVHGRQKSSDRLHRLGGGGSSSTNLMTTSKRSKSYSQIMSATNQTSSGKKLRRGKSEGQHATGERGDEDEDEGWTSADQTTDTDISQDSVAGTRARGESDEEAQDEGLVFGGKKKDGKAKEAENAVGMTRSDTASTLGDHKSPPAGADKTPTISAVPLPSDRSAAPHRQLSEETLAVESADESRQRTVSQSSELAQGSPFHRSEQAPIGRKQSTASVQTLDGVRGAKELTSSSPSTISSIRRKRTSLLPRDSNIYAAPPKLSTEYAIGNDARRSGPSHRASDSNVGAWMTTQTEATETGQLVDRSFDSAPHYRFSTIEPSSSSSSVPRHRKSSISSLSRSSFINLPGVTPSLGAISHDRANAESTGPQTSRAIEAMQRASQLSTGSPSSSASLHGQRERTKSTQNSSASGVGSLEAARLASKLRLTRDDLSEGLASSASRMLANSGSKYFMGVKADGPTAKAMARYNKPTVSVFVKRQDDFKTIEKVVEHGSLFDENFARASLGNADGTTEEANEQREKQQSVVNVRYVMDYGLSGPAVEKTATTQALLSTCLDNDEFEASWAPALAQAAGLGSANVRTGDRGGITSSFDDDGGIDEEAFKLRHQEGVAAAGLGTGVGGGSGGVYINGPNATPLHFLHGLTNTNDSPFPLDEADMTPSILHDAQAAAAAAVGGTASSAVHGEYVDAKNLRAVALTWAALNTTKNHIVTRRYVDPMRESIERVMMAAGSSLRDNKSGKKRSGTSSSAGYSTTLQHQQHHDSTPNLASHHTSSGHINDSTQGPHTSGNGASTPGGSLRWGWKSLMQQQQQSGGA